MTQARLIRQAPQYSPHATRGRALGAQMAEAYAVLARAAQGGHGVVLTLAEGERESSVRRTYLQAARKQRLAVQFCPQPDGTLGMRVSRREVGA